MKKRKSHLFTSKIICAFTTMIAFLYVQAAHAEKAPRKWETIAMAPGVEISHQCMDSEIPNSSHAKTCYWWFKNTTDKTVHLMYALRGDGYTVKHNQRTVNGIIVGKTDLTLPPRFEQQYFECISGQCLTAFGIKEVRVLAFRKDDGTTDSAKDSTKAKEISTALAAAPLTTPAPTTTATVAVKELQFCQPFKEVILGACRCSPGYYASDDSNSNTRICLKKEKTAGQTPSGNGSNPPYGPPPPPREPTEPEKMICGH